MDKIVNVMTKVGTALGGLTSLLLSFVSLSILAEIIFGAGIFGTSVVENIMVMFSQLGDSGFIGVLALLVIVALFQKK